MGNDAFLVSMGARISNRRKELHYTQEQLAEKMGVSLQTVSCIELGKKAIRPENLTNLCRELNVSADYILCGKRNEQQMIDMLEKISTLSLESYQAIRNLVDLLYDKENSV